MTGALLGFHTRQSDRREAIRCWQHFEARLGWALHRCCQSSPLVPWRGMVIVPVRATFLMP